MASKYYAVKKGKVPGIYLNWNDCKAMVDGYPGAVYKSFKTIEEAEKYRNFYLKIEKKSQEELGEDTYYIVDLIGINVYSENDEYLGTIEDVFPTGSNDVYVVKDNLGKQILVPAIAEVVKEVELKNKKMVIKIIPGLI